MATGNIESYGGSALDDINVALVVIFGGLTLGIAVLCVLIVVLAQYFPGPKQ